MKKGIHPENYRMVAFKDMSNEDIFLTKSTANANETIEVDGVEYRYNYAQAWELFDTYEEFQGWCMTDAVERHGEYADEVIE